MADAADCPGVSCTDDTDFAICNGTQWVACDCTEPSGLTGIDGASFTGAPDAGATDSGTGDVANVGDSGTGETGDSGPRQWRNGRRWGRRLSSGRLRLDAKVKNRRFHLAQELSSRTR